MGCLESLRHEEERQIARINDIRFWKNQKHRVKPKWINGLTSRSKAI